MPPTTPTNKGQETRDLAAQTLQAVTLLSGDVERITALLEEAVKKIERHETILKGNGDGVGLAEQVRALKAEFAVHTEGEARCPIVDVIRALYGDPKDPHSRGIVAEVNDMRKEHEKKIERTDKMTWLLASTLVVSLLNLLIERLPQLVQLLTH